MFAFAWLACSEYKIDQQQPNVDPTTTATTPTTPVEDTATTPVDTETTPVDTATTPTTTTPVADAPVYANTSTDLFEIDPTTGARTRVGSFHDASGPVDSMVDIAIDLQGHIYGGTYDSLYQIDAHTAEAAKVCSIAAAAYALAFDSNGNLFAGAGSDIVKIDVSTCKQTSLVSASTWQTSGDLVGLPDGYLYWTVLGDPTDELVRVNPQNGQTLLIGPVGETKLFGLGYDQGELYGFSADGSIVRIDPGDGSTTLVFADTTGWWGATTNPVVW